MASEEQEQGRLRQLLAARDPAFLAVLLLVVLGVCLVCTFGILLLNPFGGDEEASPVAEAPLTPIATPATQESLVIYEPLVTTPISLPLDAPVFLEVQNVNFPVTTRFIQEGGAWDPGVQDNTAAWVYGTIVNYVFGLPGTEENEALLEGLIQGDPITLQTKEGDELEFIFTGRELTTQSNAELFLQNRPGITLVWLGDKGNGQRLVVRGDYVVEGAEDVDEPTIGPIELGESAQIGNALVTVTGATHAVDRPEAPPGFALYFVDYEIENAGTGPLDTGLLRFVLADELGNQYSLNAAASQAGNHPLLSGFLNVGETRLATAGYQIPAGLSSPTLRWSVSRVDNPSQIEVILPFTGDAGSDAIVDLQAANVSEDGTSLVLVGQLTNAGLQPLIINEADVSMTSADGDATAYFILATTPRFPWSVASGQSMQFSVTFQRPSTNTAVFNILNHSFQLNGLR